MDDARILDDRRVLLVDDEPDVLETLEELLYMCRVDTAGSYDAAVTRLATTAYDAAVLDIMGVQGFSLLEITRRKNIPTLMLTAHALTPESLKTAMNKGADAYVPKDQMADIALFLSDVLTARKEGKQANADWMDSVRALFDKLFGSGWRKDDPGTDM